MRESPPTSKLFITVFSIVGTLAFYLVTSPIVCVWLDLYGSSSYRPPRTPGLIEQAANYYVEPVVQFVQKYPEASTPLQKYYLFILNHMGQT